MEAEIRAILQEGGVSFKQNGKSFIMTCPRCSKKDKLYLRRKDGRFVCWYCKEIDGFNGKPEYALHELSGVPVQEIRKKLYGDDVRRPAEVYLDIDIRDFEDEDADDFLDLAPKVKAVAWPLDFYDLSHEVSGPGRDYLEGRGIPTSVAREYGIRYYPGKRRIIFPVQSRGELYGWQERLTEGDKPYWDARRQKVVSPLKVVTMTDLPRDRVLMFADRLNGSDHCVLTEGPVDALKAHLCGGNVATMGKAVAGSQLDLIQSAGVSRVYLGLDPDAYLEVNRIRKILTDVVLYDLRPPAPYNDLGEMPMEAVRHLFDNAPVLNPGHVVLYLKDHFGAS